MQKEINALHENNRWDIMELPKGKSAMPNKSFYKVTTLEGKAKYKVRLVAKAYKQLQGISFLEVSTPIVKMTTLRTVFANFK